MNVLRKLKQVFKKDDFIDEQIDIVEAKIRAGGMTSHETARWLDVREKLIDSKKKNKKDVDWIRIAELAGDLGLKALSIGVTIMLTKYGYDMMANLADKSYGLDTDMVLCNGRTWNLSQTVRQMIPKKVEI